MKITKAMMKTFSVLLAMILLISSVNIVGEAATSGSNNSRSIIVKTRTLKRLSMNYSSITLTQSKGKYSYSINDKSGRKISKKTGTTYGFYTVVCVPIKGRGSSKSCVFDGSSKTIKLDSDTTYKVTIKYENKETERRTGVKSKITWSAYPKWRVNSAIHVDTYS